MRLLPLASGSQGNATLVEFGDTRLLVDAGLSERELARRLHAVGVEPRRIDYLLVSHEHQDHARGVERFSRRHGVPVVCSAATLEALDLSPQHLADWVPLPEAAPLGLGPVRVEAFPVPHDAARPVGFVLRGAGLRVGIVTDLGHATTLVLERLRGCELLMVEANHDDRLLQEGPYPWHLKQRVGGRFGHLSNDETAALLRQVAAEPCRAVVLAHLSEQNNLPALARQAAAAALADAGHRRV
ncbi:MAG TPA: MBL fold metallo-hydrolase, partial [Candidatus Polarisedimenticolaceae bacterium]|nr:MBL fold metallo-hydrolase [Candidatus Polarisedimenticolaceae bacterium]